MTDAVDDTLSLWRSTPFAWGVRDCMLSIGDYIASQGGQDVTGRFRGAYDDMAGALTQMAAHGGCTGLVDMTGLRRTATPVRGDVVAVRLDGDTIGGICTGDAVAMRTERGVIEVRSGLLDIVAAWSIR